MKKVLLLSLLVFLSMPLFAEYGVGVKLGIGENDPKTINEMFDYYGGDKTENEGIFSLEFLYEFPLRPGDEVNKLGVKAGLDFYGENELKVNNYYVRGRVTENTYALPITGYYKYDGGLKNFSFYGGAGLTFIRTKLEADSEDISKNKLFPHIAGGAEYRFTKLFALGLDLKYNISAKVEKDGATLSDRSGFSAALAGRFYF